MISNEAKGYWEESRLGPQGSMACLGEAVSLRVREGLRYIEGVSLPTATTLLSCLWPPWEILPSLTPLQPPPSHSPLFHPLPWAPPLSSPESAPRSWLGVGHRKIDSGRWEQPTCGLVLLLGSVPGSSGSGSSWLAGRSGNRGWRTGGRRRAPCPGWWPSGGPWHLNSSADPSFPDSRGHASLSAASRDSDGDCGGIITQHHSSFGSSHSKFPPPTLLWGVSARVGHLER